MDTLLARNIDKIAEPVHVMEVLTQSMVWSEALIKLVVLFVKYHVDSIKE